MGPSEDSVIPDQVTVSQPVDRVMLPAGVALTAVAMARERQVESERADRLFDDPLARAMVAAGTAATSGAPSWLVEGATLGDIAPGMAGYVAMRTRWIDDRVLARVAQSSCDQIVVLGAGLDTRAVRLGFPAGVSLYALDQPEVVALAEGVLGAAAPGRASLVYIGTDLAGDWATDLQRSGFVVSAPTVWVIEGVLMYLAAHDAERLIARIRDLSGAGSSLIADLAHPNVHHNALFSPGRRTLGDNGSPLRSSVTDPRTWFAAHGWTAQTADPLTLAAQYGRPVPLALDPRVAGGPSFWLVEAQGQDR